METATSPTEIKTSPNTSSPPRKVRPMSPFLQTQASLQEKLHCDYVLIWYERDPSSPVGKMPNYLPLGDPIPVKLSHHVYMQIAFGTLKDRLMKKSSVKRQAPAPSGTEDVNMKEEQHKSPVAQSPLKNTPTAREQDIVALFCFLWQYTMSMLNSQDEAFQHFSPDSSSPNKTPTTPPQKIKMTKQQLRFQMLLEYGVDVQKYLGDGLPTATAVSEEYCRKLVTENITEEEFYQQLAKSSKMAQECSVM